MRRWRLTETTDPKPSGFVSTELVCTGQQFFYENCPACNGKGRVPDVDDVGGWYLVYQYQDGHETAGPYTKEEAVKRYLRNDHDRQSCILIGPDGKIYKVGGK